MAGALEQLLGEGTEAGALELIGRQLEEPDLKLAVVGEQEDPFDGAGVRGRELQRVGVEGDDVLIVNAIAQLAEEPAHPLGAVPAVA